MILLDTNVISEVMKVAPSANVLKWLNDQTSSAVHVSAVTVGEIEYGLRILPDGRRRLQLKEKFEQFIALAFAQRVLGYDEAAARLYGEIMGSRKELGRPMSVPDGQIAAIARSHGLSVATRNTRDFEECGVDLLNPFDSE
ncbi:MAG: type II toxin-antitoxin system VapC family toxin [Gammaproteobacteria bacterium]|nr:MAG: type II toxin-antitoxin system VapC family toxin [Gammaproteobacteria bacterium]